MTSNIIKLELKESSSQIFPTKDISVSQIWNGDGNNKMISSSDIVMVSLYAASTGKFVVLDCNSDGQVSALEVESSEITSKYAWKMVPIQFNLPGPSPGTGFLMYHQRTNLYLTVEKGVPVGRTLVNTDMNQLSPFMWGNRFTDRDFLYLGDPTQEYFCSRKGMNPAGGGGLSIGGDQICSNSGLFGLAGTCTTDCDAGGDGKEPGYCLKGNSQRLTTPGASGQLATAFNNSNLSGVSCPDFNVTWPIGGTPYIRLVKSSGKWSLAMSGVKNSSYPITRINDPENEWYSLPILKTDSFPTPVCRSWSVQQMLDWDPSLDYNAPYNRSRVKRRNRFTEANTQADPTMLAGPHKMCLTVNNLQEGWLNCQAGPNPYTYNFQFWNSIDYIIFGTNDQGWAPLEFKNLTIPACCPTNNTNQSLYTYLDGARSGAPSQVFIPPRFFIDNAHEHGVKVLGSIFFQEQYYGSRWEWLEKFATNWKETAHQLVDMAIYYGHDGYFLDNETMPIAYVSAEKKNETSVYSTNLTRKDADYPNSGGKSVDLEKEGDKIEKEQFWSHYYRRGQSTGGWCFLTPCQRTDTVALTRGDKSSADLQQDVLNNLVKLGQEFRRYADSKGSDVELIFYECMDNKGNISYSGGVVPGNSKIWATKDGPTFDGLLTMTPSQQIVASGQTSTYMRTKEAVKGCASGSKNYGWPASLGPSATKEKALQDGVVCKEGFVMETYGPENPKCQGIAKGDYIDCGKANQADCNTAGCCWDPQGSKERKHQYWCYKAKEPAPKNLASTCGDCAIDPSMLPVYNKFPSNKSYKFFGTAVECGDFGVDEALNSTTPKMASSGWLKDYYCGSQDCPELGKVVGKQQPLTSFSLYGCGKFSADKFTFEQNVIATSGAFFPPDRELPGTAPPPTDDTMYPMSYIFPERSTLTTLPFYTSFDIGQGRGFFIEGQEQISYGSYSDYIQTQQPTFMFWPTKKQSGVTAMITMDSPYMSGSSLKIKVLPKSEGVDFNLYKVQWNLDQPVTISAVVRVDEKFNPPEAMYMRVGYWVVTSDDVKPVVTAGNFEQINSDWTRISITVPAYKGAHIGMVTVGVSGTDCDAVCYVGKISARQGDAPRVSLPSDLKYKLSNTVQGELIWTPDPSVSMYYIYRGREFIGRVKCGDNALSEPIRYNIQNGRGSYSVRSLSHSGELSNKTFPIGGGVDITCRVILILLALVLSGFALYMGLKGNRLSSKISYVVTALFGIILACSPLSGYLPVVIGTVLILGICVSSGMALSNPQLPSNLKPVIIVLFILTLIITMNILRIKFWNQLMSSNVSNEAWRQLFTAQMVDLTQKPYPVTQTLVNARADLRIDALDKYTKLKAKNKDLASLFYNAYLCPINFCISNLNDEFSYTITGNWGKGPPLHTGTMMGGMWLRDSVLQVKSYIKASRDSSSVATIVEGILNRCMQYFMSDSYANAFNPYSQFSTDSTFYQNGKGGQVATANYEMDGPCFLFMVIAEYCDSTGNHEFIRSSRFRDAFGKFVTQLQKEQHRYSFQLRTPVTDNMKLVGNSTSLTEQTTYRFSEMADGGIGSYVADMSNGKGMSYSAFRPSDDVSVFGYNVPDNMLAVAALNKVSKCMDQSSNLYQQTVALSRSIDAAIKELGVFNHPIYGKIYAFELDGLGADTFLGDGTTKAFTLNGAIPSDCDVYEKTDQFGTDTGCNPYYPYMDTVTRTQPPDGNACSQNLTATIKTSSGTNTDQRLTGTRYLEVLIDGKPVPFGNITLKERILTLSQPVPKNSVLSVRGNFNLMDDANLPSLLCIPWIGYDGVAWSPEIYENTRKFCLSSDNRWFYNYGKTGIQGIGSGHTAVSTKAGAGMVWPMAMVSRGLTRITGKDNIDPRYAQEVADAVRMVLMTSDVDLINTGVGITPPNISPYQAPGYVHESVWVTNVNRYTRGFFGWANAYFAEFIIDLLDKNNLDIVLDKIGSVNINNTKCS